VTSVDPARLRDAASRAADGLVGNAIRADGQATWLGATVAWDGGTAEVVSRTGEATVYDGSAGIALAAWAVAQSLGRDDLAAVAVEAARHAVAGRARVGGTGLFDGLVGIALAALEVGTGAGDPALVEDGLALLEQVDTASVAPAEADLVSGSAGAVLALAAAARRTGSDRWLRAAARHAEHLLVSARRYTWGWGWAPFGYEDAVPLCGLAHGAAGVAWAFGELAAALDDDRFHEGAEAARRYERSWFDAATNNWPDLRAGVTPGSDGLDLVRPSLWCHGGVGIGLSRLALFRLAGTPAMAAEAACALQSSATAATSSLGAGDLDAGLTICHGLGGAVLLVLAAHGVFGGAEHLHAARWIAGRTVDQLGSDPCEWPSGVRGGAFSAGLMTGLAGTLYVLARAADPAGVGALVGITP
jgi:lantibiotic biosynthesis protein